jgi:hypothetical protein
MAEPCVHEYRKTDAAIIKQLESISNLTQFKTEIDLVLLKSKEILELRQMQCQSARKQKSLKCKRSVPCKKIRSRSVQYFGIRILFDQLTSKMAINHCEQIFELEEAMKRMNIKIESLENRLVCKIDAKAHVHKSMENRLVSKIDESVNDVENRLVRKIAESVNDVELMSDIETEALESQLNRYKKDTGMWRREFVSQYDRQMYTLNENNLRIKALGKVLTEELIEKDKLIDRLLQNKKQDDAALYQTRRCGLYFIVLVLLVVMVVNDMVNKCFSYCDKSVVLNENDKIPHYRDVTYINGIPILI